MDSDYVKEQLLDVKEQLGERISAIEQNMKNLEAEDNTVTTQLEESIQDLRMKFTELLTTVQTQTAIDKQTAQDNAFVVAGYTFRAVPTPKQDAMKDGINAVGKPGIALEISDGNTISVVARITYDHRLQRMVLVTGTGAQ